MGKDKISFGTALRSPYEVATAAAQIEDLGFDILSCGEHVTFHGDSANGIVSLSVAAGATEHINLMSSITLLPLYPPALLAKMGAALDIASGGRFILGVGVGGENPKEFEACSVPVKQRGSRTDECLEILERVWTNTDVSYEGRYTTLDNFSLKPLPLQKPRPPIWISGRKEVAMRRAARYGDGWLPYMYTPEQLADSIEKIKTYGAELGRDLSDFQPGLFIFTNVNEDSKLAIAQAAETLGRTYAQDFTQLVGKYALAGNPDQVQARLNEYIEAGARTVLLSTACADEDLDDNLNAIANHIIRVF
ncbi:MAG TPA: LLM class F420-dependent oxidoreductase [Gammaproteobacteria bacterium]|nr:LLM class F420-dependent oxidoreductase [Gammaproteobacteria bacterium]|tara:strand:+ start:1242 stop:2159 length:918 start_codon:yes stop_codon:yes gene_type:complete